MYLANMYKEEAAVHQPPINSDKLTFIYYGTMFSFWIRIRNVITVNTYHLRKESFFILSFSSS
jgi:hypothetical protein